MSGIYVHVPFCLSKCFYCAFYSRPSLKGKEAYLASLKQEMVSRKDYLHGETIGTIYFGGGTPSLLSVSELKTIFDLIYENYPIEPYAEITLEANPDTLSPEYLEGLRSLGVNRLSIGIQSFFDDDLRYLGRRHDSRHARQCIDWAHSAGFENISLDLIYGLPTSDADRWNRNLDLFFATGAPHLSAYALTLEPNSILTRQIALGRALPVEEEAAIRDYEILCRRAAEEGFLHYEVSNFCQPRHQSRHNASYWSHIPYLGLGPSAHSYDGNSRQWNSMNTERRPEKEESALGDSPFSVNHGWVVEEKETLTPEQIYNEYVMLRLRTMWGIDLKYMKREMGRRFSDYCERKAQPLIDSGQLSRTCEFLYLTDAQMLFADGIAETLFW